MYGGCDADGKKWPRDPAGVLSCPLSWACMDGLSSHSAALSALPIAGRKDYQEITKDG